MAMKPITFSDGTFVPEGTIIVAGTLPQHRDEEAYPEAYAFDPWRFEQSPTEDTARKQFATTDATFLPFGHGERRSWYCAKRVSADARLCEGKHACPGRIFAGQEIKAMLVHLLTKHEMRTEVEGVRPKDSFIGSMAIPDSKAKVLFRRRRV
jgi:cytochrome P450